MKLTRLTLIVMKKINHESNMGKQFGINERKLKLKIPFVNLIMIIHKSYHSQYNWYIKFNKENWDSNPKSVLEGLHCVYSIDIAKNGIWYSIDFVKQDKEKTKINVN